MVAAAMEVVPPSGEAHSPQNFASGAFAVPQFAHTTESDEAHSLQNFRPASFAVPQFEQITLPSGTPSDERPGHWRHHDVSQLGTTSLASASPRTWVKTTGEILRRGGAEGSSRFRCESIIDTIAS